MNRLTIKKGAHEGRRYSIRGAEVSVGSGEGCTIRLDDSRVEKKHFVLKTQDDEVSIELYDEASDLRVNGKPAASGYELKHGDEIQVGNTTLGFTNVALHAGMEVRRFGKMQMVTLGAIVLVLILEGLFLLGFSMFRGDRASLELLKKEELERKLQENAQAEAAPNQTRPEKRHQFEIRALNFDFHRDDQLIYDICLIDLHFRSRHGLNPEEVASVRVEAQILEKVGTNEWSDSKGVIPKDEWRFIDATERGQDFFSRATLLFPRSLSAADAEENVFDEVRIGGTVRVYFDGTLQDEEDMKFNLPEDMRRPRPVEEVEI